MPLTFSQQRAYRDSIDVWRKDGETNHATSGKVSDGTWSRVLIGLACGIVLTTNVDDPTGIGRLKKDNLETVDSVYMEYGVDIRSTDLVVMTSRGNAAATVQGAPTPTPTQGPLAVNEQFVRTSEEEHPPDEVLEAYA